MLKCVSDRFETGFAQKRQYLYLFQKVKATLKNESAQKEIASVKTYCKIEYVYKAHFKKLSEVEEKTTEKTRKKIRNCV